MRPTWHYLMAMTISSVNAVAAVALATMPASPASITAWLADFTHVAVERANETRAFSSGTYGTQRWEQFPASDLRVTSLLLQAPGNSIALANGTQVSWEMPAVLLEVQSFFSLERGWDGEDAPEPNLQSVIAAIEFLQRTPFASQWTAALNADGSVSLESDDGAGLGRELLFRSKAQVVTWLEAEASARSMPLEEALLTV